MKTGIYEQLIHQLIRERLTDLGGEVYFIGEKKLDKEEATRVLTLYLSEIISRALDSFEGKDALENKITFANQLISWINKSLKDEALLKGFDGIEARVLKGIIRKIDADVTIDEAYLDSITPSTRLIHSDLFTGGKGSGVSLASELKKEILSADRIDFLVSFIRYTGLRLLLPALRTFTKKGGKLRVITTTYVGVTEAKAVMELSKLDNTEIKISYDTKSERVHAKAYLFYRNSGFHTAYIGSSNFSKSALTEGLEWNIKITTKEISHVIDKFRKTFESYWKSEAFENFSGVTDETKLRKVLNEANKPEKSGIRSFNDLRPYPFQAEILEKLQAERQEHNRYRNLVVAATGTGKTVISALDFSRFYRENKGARLLFVAHRKEILEQARDRYQEALRDANFGELWVDGLEPTRFDQIFASVQTLNNRLEDLKTKLTPGYFDYIVIDEVHHIPANSYRGVITYFRPKILMGLTATPERTDGIDILSDFDDHIAAEIRLNDAINRQLLSPFHYFGITDPIDHSTATWRAGKYDASELSQLYVGSRIRTNSILDALAEHTSDPQDVQALCFCITQDHAVYMADIFKQAGYKAQVLVSRNSSERTQVISQLRKKEINYLFVVDMLNEGVDIPEIDTILLLRPTESLIVYLQQLGRGLRLSPGKECLTVLDMVGNARPEYDYSHKLRAMLGKTDLPLTDELKKGFPNMPVGCHIFLEEKAMQHILRNIKTASRTRKTYILNAIRNWQHQTKLSLTLANFLYITGIELQTLYKFGTWSHLLSAAGKLPGYQPELEEEIRKAVHHKWLSTQSVSYFRFIKKLALQDFDVRESSFSENEELMLLMLYYDVWQVADKFESLTDAICAIGRNKLLNKEIAELMDVLIDRIWFVEKDIKLPYNQPLKIHAIYTRDQILAAFRFSTFEKRSSNREGVANNKDLNTELLFVDLHKSEEDYSPSTMYNDYAITPTEFHWQSQNSASPNTEKGKSYIEHKNNKRILMFLRDRKKDAHGLTKGYTFIGDARYQRHEGEKPMNIIWQLENPIPDYLLEASMKMS